MAVEKKDNDMLIQPQQEVVEETAPESMEDVLANVWGVRLQGKKDAIESAAGALSGVAKEAEESRAAMERAKARQGSFLHSLLEEQKPIRKEDEEKRLRNKALVKGFGDLVSAIAAGVNAYGKKGAGVVPTLASNSPLKDIEKLNAMQDEYLQRKEAWDALNLRMRMDEENAKLTDAQNAYARSLERMAAAQSNYDNAVEGYEQTMENYGNDMQDIYLEGMRQDRADRRAMLNTAGRGKEGDKKEYTEAEKEKIALDAYNVLYPWEARSVISSNTNWLGQTGTNSRPSTYSEDEPRRKAQARIDEYAQAVVRAVTEGGYTFEEAVAKVSEYMKNETGYYYNQFGVTPFR